MEGMESFLISYAACFKVWQNLILAYEQLLRTKARPMMMVRQFN